MPNKIENIALFDMDGTIADFDGQLHADLERIRCPYEAEIDMKTLHNRDIPDYMKQRIKTIRAVPEWWRNLPQIPLGMRILRMAQNIGFEINILTKGPSNDPNAWKEKVEWVRYHLGDVKVTITEDKGLVYGKVLVDDYLPYMERWLTWRPRGLGIMPVDLRYYEKKEKVPENVIQISHIHEIDIVNEALIKAYNR
jgi:5'(3')-deoxyribonucleotidase